MSILRHDGESKFNYIKRLTDNRKEYDLTYNEWVKLICNYECSSENGRKAHYVLKRLLEELEDEFVDNVASSDEEKLQEMLEELELQKIEFMKERVKLQDQKRVFHSSIRAEARWENAMDSLQKSINNLPPIEIKFGNSKKDGVEACILISDTHFGKGVNTPHNKFNLEIAQERLENLATQVIKYATMHNVSTLHVDMLGDLIENNLHIDARVEQVCNAMEQVAYAGEFLSQFISQLAPHFKEIKLHSVAGNHDRLEKQYKDSRDVENFVRLIDTFIELRTGLKFERSKVDQEIEVYTLNNGTTIALQHGHNVKNVETLVKDVSNYLGMNIDYCHIGHFHSFKSVKGTIVNGSLCGSDSYANKLRYNDKASQVLAVYYEDGTQVIHNIILN